MTNRDGGGPSADLLEADLIVIGAGMGGMTAAARCAAAGSKVVVIEKAPAIGGSAVLSGGGLWTAGDVETMRRINPMGDPGLGELVVSTWAEVADWIASTGVEIEEKRELDAGSAPGGFPAVIRKFDVIGYIGRCRTIVESAGGVVATGATVLRLSTRQGAVVGAVVRDRDGVAELRAPHTVLATGGFQGDRELRREFLGSFTADVLVRSNPYSTGDGLRLGRSVGAALTPNLDGWYGHTVPYPLAGGLEPKDYIRFAQFGLSPHSLLLNRAGQRFVDESAGYYRNAQAVCRQPDQRALLVFDETVRAADTNRRGAVEQVDRPREAELAGAHVVREATWREVEARVAAWGYRGVDAAVKQFNAAVIAGNDRLGPARAGNRRVLVRPPFYAMEVQPAITFTHGGLRVDRWARVLGTDGEPITGLLAAGVDAAGTYHVAYAGGLAMSGALGLAAAGSALADPTAAAAVALSHC
ncbi:FAD-dependent oxidoreductase [Actinomadura sp. LD22]|uniref:FAD-dependent oxidoreductase n=1 Tax=Actinomadura physcomitrii TaxID=2650748 RepID=A0A6I4MKV4_9ACTN|nr:FAD-dependent oxidoreductase [Actinomadura physcomitrii]MWA04824.1 FAD-dependent oxidoreductase [Actinomadura physcomitrii]